MDSIPRRSQRDQSLGFTFSVVDQAERAELTYKRTKSDTGS